MNFPPPDSFLSARRAELSALGWVASGQIPHRSSVELTQSGSWTLSRLWSTPGRLQALPLTEGTVRVIIGVDGVGSIHHDDSVIRLEPQQMLVADAGAFLATENQALWARCEWHVSATGLQQGLLADLFWRPLHLPKANYTLITAVTNVIATQKGFATSGRAGFLHDGLTSIIASALVDTRPEEYTSARQADLFRAALSVIDEEFTRHEFTVEELAATLHISDRQLRRVFTNAGITPREAIESRRISSADTLRRQLGRGGGTSTMEQAATLSGFSSVRQLRDALRRRRQRNGT